MSGTFTIPVPVETEAEILFCPLLQEAFDLWEVGDYQASLDVLDAALPFVESVSLELAGKFHNQFGLALVGLKQYDQAVSEYQSAVQYFETYGSASLLAIVKNNLAWVCLQLGQYEQAHEYIGDALLLVERDDLKAEFHDTKAQVFLEEGKPDAALVENERALALLAGSEKILAGCLASRAKIKQQKYLQDFPDTGNMVSTCTLNPKASPPAGVVAMSPTDCASEIINSAQSLAPALFSIIAAVADPDGDPVRYSLAWELMRYVNSFTAAGEAQLREEIERASLTIEESSDTPS